jgi:hypothetical protein
VNPPDYKRGALGGFLKNKVVVAQAHAAFVRRMGHRNHPSNEPLIAKTFLGPPINLMVTLKASEWSGMLYQVKAVFSEAVHVPLSQLPMRGTQGQRHRHRSIVAGVPFNEDGKTAGEFIR